jgi:putative transposase
MPFDPSLTSRHSLRLPDYDYSQPGAYFITMVTYQREHFFGEITAGEMQQNVAGRIVWEVWQSLQGRYPNISLGQAVVMPNHFHGILIIEDNSESIAAIHPENAVAAIHELPLPDKETYRLTRRRMLIPLAVGYFKMYSAKRINILSNSSGVPIWQRNYYEHIVRNDPAYDAIRLYIQSNPACWENDEENR